MLAVVGGDVGGGVEPVVVVPDPRRPGLVPGWLDSFDVGVDLLRAEQRIERLRQPRHVPGDDVGLVAKGVAALPVDGGKARCAVETLGERARAVVDGLAGQRHVVGVHHPVDETQSHPVRHQVELAAGDGAQHLLGIGEARGGDDLLRQLLRLRRRVLHRAHAQVALGHAHHNAARDRAVLADHGAAGGQHRQRPGGGHVDRVHERGDEVLAQHRPDRAHPVRARARKRGQAGALELDLMSGGVAEQQGAAVAKQWHELAELVRRVRHGVAAGSAGEELEAIVRLEPRDIESELLCKRLVERDKLRVLKFRAGLCVRELRQGVCERVGELGLIHGSTLN